LAKLQRRFKEWVNSEVAKELDKDGFFSLPLKMRIGILILLFTWLIGNGYPIVTMIISGRNHQLLKGTAQSTAVYIICWVIGAFGLSLAGKASIKYPIYFSAKLLKKLFPGYFNCE
jgi:hypothetical protein